MKLRGVLFGLSYSILGISLLALSVSSFESSAFALSKNQKLIKSLKKKGLLGIPGVADAVKKKKQASGDAAAFDSNPPPNLVDLIDADITPVFWEGGALSRIQAHNSTQSDCDDFHKGMGSCFLAQTALDSFRLAKEGETSKCYLSEAPKAASGVTFEGEGQAKDVFDPPNGPDSKYVQINVAGFPSGDGEGGGGGGPEQIIARVYSNGENGSKFAYRIDLAFCDPESQEMQGFNRIAVKSDGKLQILDSHSGEDKHAFSFQGYLDSNGKFDLNKSRSMSVENFHAGGSFSAKVKINGDKIVQRSLDNFQDKSRTSISVMKFLGSSLDNAKFTLGAFKFLDGDTVQGGASWDGARYIAQSDNSLLSGIENEDLEGEFYSNVPDGEMTAENLPGCDRTEFDANLELDMSDPALQEVMQKCEPLHDTQFCWNNDDVRNSELEYADACISGGGHP